ncbi:hypothetical protein [Cohnella sp.]|uniref:hypothetical protein n=1 Tax=Cohnella sp. TaxID=1883426 RepID=UPI00356ABCD8
MTKLQVPAESVKASAETAVPASGTTVLDLKKKYGSDLDKALMPLYNVPRDKVFEFKFNSDVWGEPDVITVHTDIKAEEKSRILTSVFPKDFQENANTLEVKPNGGVFNFPNNRLRERRSPYGAGRRTSLPPYGEFF